jgi:tRNA pseudouridine13 synthase
MSGEELHEEHPRKRMRLTTPGHLAAPEPKSPMSLANGVVQNEKKSDGELEKEIRAGITEYVSPDNSGFTGILKQR